MTMIDMERFFFSIQQNLLIKHNYEDKLDMEHQAKHKIKNKKPY
jgi:hypothetical protein